MKTLREMMELLVLKRHIALHEELVQRTICKGSSVTGQLSMRSYEYMGVCWMIYMKGDEVVDSDCDCL